MAKRVINDPHGFIMEQPPDVIMDFLRYCSDKYYNDEPVVPDSIFDMLIETLRMLEPDSPFFAQIGAPVRVKTRLPVHMGSMDKVKPEDARALAAFAARFKPPYLVTDKLDGISGLFVSLDGRLFMYTRGDGTFGTCISHVIPHLAGVPRSLAYDCIVRGELIMRRQAFVKHAATKANARNMVQGVLNAKRLDVEAAKDVEFVAYELVEPWVVHTADQLRELRTLGFQTVHDASVQSLDSTRLLQVLEDRKQRSDYRIDGIIVSAGEVHRRNDSGNPDYAFAFKSNAADAMVDAEVLRVEWNLSKDGYLRPRCILRPVTLEDVTVSAVAAFNARYVFESKLGPGAVVKLVRSGEVIPHIVSIVQPAAQPQMPEVEWHWDDTRVNAVAVGQSSEQAIKQLTFFARRLGIANVDEQMVRRMFQNGIDTIPKLFAATKAQLVAMDGFQERLAERTHSSIQAALHAMTLLDLMVASNAFGHGIGDKKLQAVLQAHPNLLTQTPTLDQLLAIDGIEHKTGSKILDGIPRFKALLQQLPVEMVQGLTAAPALVAPPVDPLDPLAGIKVAFTGFRNRGWEAAIAARGGHIVTTVTSSTNILVAAGEGSTKHASAARHGVRIMSPTEFAETYGLSG